MLSSWYIRRPRYSAECRNEDDVFDVQVWFIIIGMTTNDVTTQHTLNTLQDSLSLSNVNEILSVFLPRLVLWRFLSSWLISGDVFHSWGSVLISLQMVVMIVFYSTNTAAGIHQLCVCCNFRTMFCCFSLWLCMLALKWLSHFNISFELI